MATDIKTHLRESRKQEIDETLEKCIQELSNEGFNVDFGKIGIRTTYALIYDESHDTEIVGYTFIKDMKFYRENVGKLKALQQAIARKDMTSQN